VSNNTNINNKVLVAVAFASILSVARFCNADTTYSDGGVHTINTAMPVGTVNVFNNTTLNVVNPGSVTGSSGTAAEDGVDATGAILNVQGGSITGGAGPDTLTGLAQGNGGNGIFAESTTIAIQGGNVTGGQGATTISANGIGTGGEGLSSGSGTTTIQGGNVTGGQGATTISTNGIGTGGDGLLGGSGAINILGGSITGGLGAGSLLENVGTGEGGFGVNGGAGAIAISGGTITGGIGAAASPSNGQGFGGGGVGSGAGIINIQAGTIAGGAGGAGTFSTGGDGVSASSGTINIYGGAIQGGAGGANGFGGNGVSAENTGTAKIFGGAISAGTADTNGNAIDAYAGGIIDVYGSGFNTGFGIIGPGTGNISGTLADGTAFSWPYSVHAAAGNRSAGAIDLIGVPVIALSNAVNRTIITSGTAALGTSIANSAATGAMSLNYTLGAAVQSGSATLGSPSPNSGTLTPGSKQSCTVSASSTNLGVNTISFTASGSNTYRGPQTTTATLTVLDHAAAAFVGGGGTLNLNFGALEQGSGTQSLQYQIENLPETYRAGLDLYSITTIADPLGVFSTNPALFTDLAPGAESGLFDLFLNTSEPGEFSGEYQLNLSDEQDLSGWAGQQTLTLNVTADVVPEPGTLALLSVAALLTGIISSAARRSALRR
jgi:hypothetical protein